MQFRRCVASLPCAQYAADGTTLASVRSFVFPRATENMAQTRAHTVAQSVGFSKRLL